VKAFQVITTSLCVAVMISTAQPAMAKKGGNVNWDQLNLSPAQSQNINQYEGEWERTYSQLAPQIERDKADLASELKRDNPDTQRVMALQNRITQNKARLQNAAMSVHLKKNQQLDTDQKQQLKQMMFED